MIAILGRNDKANTEKWSLRFGIDRSMDYTDRLGVGVTSLILAGMIPKLNRDTSLQHQKETGSIMQMPGGRATGSDL